MKMTEEQLNQIDENFRKARVILMTYLDAHQNDGSEDHTTVIEVVMDYMNKIEDIMKEVQ